MNFNDGALCNSPIYLSLVFDQLLPSLLWDRQFEHILRKIHQVSVDRRARGTTTLADLLVRGRLK